MNTIRSSDFRKGYAKLSEPTVVTVLGRPIGTFIPGQVLAPEDWASDRPTHWFAIETGFTEVGVPGRPELRGNAEVREPVIG